MKKQILVLIILVVIAIISALIYFFITQNNTIDVSVENNKTAEEIANELKTRISSVGNIVAYTEETDLNDLLGRPNQYTSKATFQDTRLEQINLNNEFLTEEERKEPTGGTIEVFNNKDDMLNRKKYIESITSSISALSEYIYAEGNVLLRLEHELTPEQAKEYEEAFYEIVK